MEKKNLIKHFNDWCSLTGRSGGVLIGRSVREFFDYLVERDSVKEEIIEQKPIGFLNKDLSTYFGGPSFSEGHEVYDMGDKYHLYYDKGYMAYYKNTLDSLITKTK